MRQKSVNDPEPQIPETACVYAISLAGRSFEGEVGEALAWMTIEEREKYRRFHFERHRLEFAVSRYLLRSILGRLTGFHPSRLDISREQWGKPFLPGPGMPSFNLTHTDEFVALLTGPAGARLGLDAEPVDRAFDALLLTEVFEECERARLADSQAPEADPISFWTAKEAYLKQLGSGLSIEPRRLRLAERRGTDTHIYLDEELDPRCCFHFTTIGRHRLCAATETRQPPWLFRYGPSGWERLDAAWSS
jgi:4'-phosphopantetheinyl transferase